MNHTYKHIWSKTLGRLVIVPECCKGGQGRKGGKTKLGAVAVAAATVLASPAMAQSVLPTGGTVVSGAASIATNGAAMTINQSSDKLIANWQSFSIGAGNSVTFNQPGASSVALNRVTGQDASQILGSLTSNGQVFLVNPNGIAIGKTGSVQTGAFVASTLGISDANFLAGNYRFTGTSGTITNEGSVSGKTVALISPVVSNSGTITGNTALAAGTDVQLDFNGDGLLSVEVKASTMATLVENKGLIRADGGVAILTAKGASAAMKGVVNNTGTVEANSIGTRNGRILLLGDMQHGEVKAAGKLKAKFVETSAAKVTIDKDLKVDTQGGTWLIDPTDIEINAGNVGGYLSGLATGNLIIQTPAAGSELGNIAINAAMSWTSPYVLTLTANNNIAINAAITAASGGLTINAPGTITATAAISLGTFVLNSGSWQQTAATLPSFYAKDFQLNGGAFLRVTGGDGSSATPYLLADIYGVQGIGSSAGYLAASWKLANDIDASGTANWNAGDGFRPIQQNALFTGTLDGDNHVISHLSILAPLGNAGLFAQIGSSGTVKNLGITDATVISSNTAGILAGGNDGIVTNVWTSGTVTNSEQNTGGLVGANSGTISGSWSSATVYGRQIAGGLVGLNDGTISGSWSSSAVNAPFGETGGLVGWQTGGSVTLSYATGAVQGGVLVGGLVGWQTGGDLTYVYATGAVSGSDGVGGLVGGSDIGSISNAYATGAVTGDPSCQGCYVGGLTGYGGSVTNSFWDINTTGQTSSGRGTGLTTAQMRSAASYTGWDFTSVWYQSGDMRPILRAEAATADSNGVITISNLHQLALIGANLSGNYKLAVNLDASATKGLNASDIWSTNGWVGLANFAGTLDGSKHAISGLTSNTGGLFASTTSSATIHDLGVTNASISGTGDFTGILVDDNAGTLTNVSTSGTVSGQSTGGLAGQSSGAISGSWSSAEVDAHWPWSGETYSAGGLVAVLTASGTISQSYATGFMNYGMGYVGGLVGSNYGTISFSYATGALSPYSLANGGLVSANFGTISNSYATGAIGASGLSGGLVALNYNTISQSYAAGSVDTSTFGGGGLVGYTEGTITASFWDTQASGLSTGVGSGPSTGVTGLTTAQMQNPTNFINAGWDYASTWAMVKTGGAPVLRALTSDPVYTYYVNLSGNTSTTYGDGITSTSGITVGGPGAGNVSVAWGSAIGATTNAGTYGYGSSNVLSLSYSTGAAGDYYVDYGTGSLTINKRVVSLSGTRTYDGTTDVGAGVLTIGNLANGETLTLAGIGTLSSKNVGTGLGFGLGTLALGNGTGLAANYTLTGSTRTVDITKATITAITGITADNKTYDATTAATLVLSGAGFSGMASGDVLTVATASGAFIDKNAGAGKTVNISGLALGGADAGNYTLSSTTASTTADIARAVITSIAGITATNKTYDGTDEAALVLTGATINGKIAGDVLTVATSSGAFSDKNAATGKTVNITGLSLGGTDAGNYTLGSTTASTTADIAKAVITGISGIAASNKTYDGTDAATLVLTGAVFNGKVSGDVLTVATSSGAFGDKNAATGKTVNITGLSLGGTDAGNYTLSSSTASTTADIAKAAITSISGITAGNKTYDGTDAATLVLTGAAFNGKVSGDVLTVATSSGAFDNKNAGTGKTVNISGLSLGGTDAGNYTLSSSTASTTADIAKAIITSISGITASNRTYDGTDAATLVTSGAVFNGKISGDVLTVATGAGTFLDKDAASGKTVNITGLSLGGADAGNYTLSTTTASTTADIAKAVITGITGITATNKTYDGTTAATLNTSNAGFTGRIGTEVLTVASASGAFIDKNAGSGKVVNITGLTLGGADAGNYTLSTSTATTTADITKAIITSIAGITAGNKTYDGTTDAALVTSGATFNGKLAGDVLTVASSTGAFSGKDVGNGVTVGISGLTLGGTDAGNYTLSTTTAATTANIVQRVLSLSGGRVYDGTSDVAANVLALGNLVSGETLVLSGAGQLSSKDAGSGRSFSLGTLALGNGSGLASNYTLAGGTYVVDIAKAVLTLSGFTVANRTYDGTTAAAILNAGTLNGVLGGDNVSFVSAGASFADKNAGTGKMVTLNGGLIGADASNYTLAPGGTTTTADIARAVIASISGVTALSKPYDGSTNATLVTSGAVFNGMVAGDLLRVATGIGTFADANSGTGKRVNIAGLSLGGLDAGNYTLASTTTTTTADINASVAPVLPPPNTINTGTSVIAGIGGVVRQSFVVTATDAFAQPQLIDLGGPGNRNDTGNAPANRGTQEEEAN